MTKGPANACTKQGKPNASAVGGPRAIDANGMPNRFIISFIISAKKRPNGQGSRTGQTMNCALISGLLFRQKPAIALCNPLAPARGREYRVVWRCQSKNCLG